MKQMEKVNLFMQNNVKTETIFSPEQQEVIDTWGVGMAVLAGAGSGKTTTLVAKCIRLVEKDPKARFAAVSFTERSTSDLRSKLSRSFASMGIPGAINQHWVMTIHGLCGAIIGEYPREAGFEGEETILSESEAQLLWERAIESLWLDDLPDDVRVALENLLDRESRDGLAGLLKRVKELSSFGVLKSLAGSSEIYAQSLGKTSAWILEKYNRLKSRQGAIDFHDLECGADRVLNFPEVCQIYHRRFNLILVDEFQDTNPLQARIIWRLAQPRSSNLCVVGDPKQSIYRFRDADVTVFEEFCAQLPIQKSLTWNFRSLPGVLSFANRVCEKAFVKSGMRFEALIPKREPVDDEETVLRLDVQTPAELGNWIQGEVARGVPLDDMALLVRKIRGNEKWLRALTAWGVPIAVGSGGLFWEEPRIRELVAFLKWWDNPGNSLSGGIFLRAPWMGISDQELDRWVKEDSTWQIPFFNSDHPVARQLKPHLKKAIRPGELLFSLFPEGPAGQAMEEELGAPLLGLWHRVEELSTQGLDFHAVVSELSKAIEEKRREREVPAPRNLGQLSVLTLHGAKGLEFPQVILIDFPLKTRAAETPLLFWDRIEGAYLGTRDENGDRDRKNPKEISWRELEKRKNLAESKRLFYVALTRAKNRLVLVCPDLSVEEKPKDKGKDKVDPADFIYDQDNWRGWIIREPLPRVTATERGIPRVIQSQQVPPISSPSPEVLLPSVPAPFPETQWVRARHSVTEWTLLSRCPRAYEWTFIRPITVPVPAPEVGLPTESTQGIFSEGEFKFQSEIGTRVHACLESGDLEELRKLETEVGQDRFSAEPLIQWVLQSPWMAPAQREKGRDVWKELPFEVPFGSEVLVGSIDRLVKETRDDLPHYTLIDFKVSEKPKSIGSMRATYKTQIELYAQALTALDPSISLDRIQAYLVNISGSTVQTVSIPLGKLNLRELIDTSLSIIRGSQGTPSPGFMCRYCDFRSVCPDAKVEAEAEGEIPVQLSLF